MSNVRLVRPGYRQKVHAGLYAKMVSHLMIGASVRDLVEETGLTKFTVRKYVNALYNHGVIHIASWEAAANGRRVLAVYRVGRQADARKPRMSGTERTARYRAKVRREKERALQKAWKEAA